MSRSAVGHGLGWPPLRRDADRESCSPRVALAIDRLFYRPFRAGHDHRGGDRLVRRRADAALGDRAVLGRRDRPYRERHRARRSVLFDTLLIAQRHLAIVAAAILLVVALHLFLTRTTHRQGDARDERRSGAGARSAASTTERVIALDLGRSAPGWPPPPASSSRIDTQLNPNMGWNLLLPVFAAAILGGIGQPYGAIAGGLVIGMAEELSTYPLDRRRRRWCRPATRPAIAFAIMVAMLIWRPTGLFKGRVYLMSAALLGWAHIPHRLLTIGGHLCRDGARPQPPVGLIAACSMPGSRGFFAVGAYTSRHPDHAAARAPASRRPRPADAGRARERHGRCRR